MTSPWQYIPTNVLDEEERQNTANEWGAKYRQQVASDWAQRQMQQFGDALGRLGEGIGQRLQGEAPTTGAGLPGQLGSAPISSSGSWGTFPQSPYSPEDTAAQQAVASGIGQGIQTLQDNFVEPVANLSVAPLAGFSRSDQNSRVGLLGLANAMRENGPVQGWQDTGEYWEKNVGEAVPGMKGLVEMAIPLPGPGEAARVIGKAGEVAREAAPLVGRGAEAYFATARKLPIGLTVEDVSRQAGKSVIDPKTLSFTEADQANLAGVRQAFPNDEYSPIVVVAEPDGTRSILDGHNRAAVALERGHSLPAVSLQRGELNALQQAGYDDLEAAYAALVRAKEYDAAQEMASQFSGSRLLDRGEEAAWLLEQKPTNAAPGISAGKPIGPKAKATEAVKIAGENTGQNTLQQAAPPPNAGTEAPKIYDALGNLIGKPNKVELALDGGTPISQGLSEVLGPRGETLSVVGRPGVARTAATLNDVNLMQLSKEVRGRLPNLTKLKDMPDVVANLVGMAEDPLVGKQIDLYRRGTITHKELINDLAPRLGMTADDFLKQPIGRAYNETELLVLRNAVVQKSGDLASLAEDVAKRGGIGALSDAEKVGAMRQLVEAAQLQAVARGGASTAGRTLNQQKIVIDRAMSQAITGGNEKLAAEKAIKEATDALKAAQAKAAKQMAEAKAKNDARLVRQAEMDLARVEKEIGRQQGIAKNRLARADALMGRTKQRQQDQASKMLEALGGRKVTEDVLKNWLAVQSSGDSLAAVKFIKGLQQPTLWDRANIIRYGSMLSATSTHLTNSLGNVVQLGLDIGLKPLAVGIDIPRAALTGTERTRYMAEMGPQVRGALEGFLTGAKEAALVMKTGIDPAEASKLERIRPGFQSGNAAVDFLAEGPLRTLVAADKMLRGAAFGGQARAGAVRWAIKEGYKDAARGKRVDEIVANILDFPELLEEAQGGAARVVLQESRKETGWLAQVHNTPLEIPFSIAVPFVKTPYNIAAQGAGMTPMGFAAAIKSAKAGKTGESVDRASRALFGTAVIGVGTTLAANGLMTAGYPEDATEKSTLPPGWQPWAVRIPGADGEQDKYVSFQNLGPIGIPLAISALYGQAMRNGQPITDPAVHAQAAMGVGRYMVDNTFARGIFDLLKGLEDPQRYSENLVENLATQAVPYASLQRQITRALDMGQRDPHGAIEAILALNPATAQQVGAKYTPLGDVARQEPTGIAAFVSPLKVTTARDEPTLQALRSAGVGITAPPKSLDRLPLTRQEGQGIQTRAGADMRAVIAPLQNDPGFQALPQAARAYILERVQSEARAQAKDKSKVFANVPPEELAKRVLDMIRQELAPTR